MGIFTSAFALGTNAQALAYADGFQGFSFASAIGNKSQAFAFGDLGLAVAVGANSLSFAGSLNNTPNIGNVALSLGSYTANASRGSTTGGIANLAVNIGANTDYTTAYGTLNVGVNVLGDNNLVYAEDGTTQETPRPVWRSASSARTTLWEPALGLLRSPDRSCKPTQASLSRGLVSPSTRSASAEPPQSTPPPAA